MTGTVPSHREGVRAVLRAVRLLSGSAFELGGQRFEVLDPTTPLPQARVTLLGQQLYQQAYAHRLGSAPPANHPPGADLTPALREANPTRERWEGGWQVTQVLPGGQVLAGRLGQGRRFLPGSFLSHDGPGVPPRAGTALSVFFPRESVSVQPGFYFAFGEEPLDPDEQDRLLRLYWNVRAGGAATLLRELGGALNRYQIPFQFKCLMSEGHYTRLDAAVLYIDQRHAHLTTELALDLHPRLAGHLDPDVPLFTRPLAPGLARAEDPGNGESFGMHRCARLAEGLWSAHERGVRDEEGKWREVERAFAAHGLSLERPELRAGSPRLATPEVAHA